MKKVVLSNSFCYVLKYYLSNSIDLKKNFRKKIQQKHRYFINDTVCNKQ